MRLRDALDICTDNYSDDWLKMPSGGWGRPATTMVAGLFDPGASEPRIRPLVGHTMAVYGPDARLSLVWPVPATDEAERPDRSERFIPEWAERDSFEWKNARQGWAVVLLSGAPIWQVSLWYLDWGSGIGGYVPDFRAIYGEDDDEGTPSIAGWEVSAWDVGLARLINSFASVPDFYKFDPTPRIVPEPSKLHPVDAARSGY